MLFEPNPDKIRFLIAKIRKFDVQVEESLGGGSDALDGGFAAIFNDEPDAVRKEAEQFIGAMDVDERRERVALSLVGHGDYTKEEWKDALVAASSRPGQSTAAILLAIRPLRTISRKAYRD